MNYSSWMKSYYLNIKNRDIFNIALPATHCSGAFSKKYSSSHQYQDINIYEQLTIGIRAFDFIVRFVSSKRDFYMSKDNIWFEEQNYFLALGQIVTFLAENNMECIAIKLTSEGTDLENELSGSRRNYLLKETINRLKGSTNGLLLCNESCHIADMIRTNRRIIILTNFSEAKNYPNYFWNLNNCNMYYEANNRYMNIAPNEMSRQKLDLIHTEHLKRMKYPKFFWFSFSFPISNIRECTINFQSKYAQDFFLSSCYSMKQNIYAIAFPNLSFFIDFVIELNCKAK